LATGALAVAGAVASGAVAAAVTGGAAIAVAGGAAIAVAGGAAGNVAAEARAPSDGSVVGAVAAAGALRASSANQEGWRQTRMPTPHAVTRKSIPPKARTFWVRLGPRGRMTTVATRSRRALCGRSGSCSVCPLGGAVANAPEEGRPCPEGGAASCAATAAPRRLLGGALTGGRGTGSGGAEATPSSPATITAGAFGSSLDSRAGGRARGCDDAKVALDRPDESPPGFSVFEVTGSTPRRAGADGGLSSSRSPPIATR
jgi:type IV secretion system protein TrbL